MLDFLAITIVWSQPFWHISLISKHAISASSLFRTPFLLQIFPYDVAVSNLLVVHETDQLIVLSTSEVASVPLHRCSQQLNCGDCVALQDPYCAWDIKSNTCQADKSGHEQLQNVNIGYHPQCPVPILDTTTSTTSTTTEKLTTTEFTTVYEEETTVAQCSQCSCECGSGTTEKPVESTDKFVDLLDIYNGTDLDNGIFDQGT